MHDSGFVHPLENVPAGPCCAPLQVHDLFGDCGELPHPPPGKDINALEWLKQQVGKGPCKSVCWDCHLRAYAQALLEHLCHLQDAQRHSDDDLVAPDAASALAVQHCT